jgi:hypothetical protein
MSIVKQLLQCMVTCRQWESVIHGNSGVWRHLELSGTLKEVDAKYTKMLKLAGGATFQTLSLGLVDWHGEGEEPLCWSETEICKRFPSGTLKSFQYASLWKKENDSKVWKSLSACKKLQKLDWEILNYSPQTYHVEGTSLAHCRLKMLTLKVTPGSDIDNDFVNLVSQANSMILHGLRKDMLWDIVNAAKENVESLECYDAYHWVTSAKPPIVMKKLKVLDMRSTDTLPLICPKVTNLTFLQSVSRGDNDWLASYCSSLVNLDVCSRVINLDVRRFRRQDEV